jgi:hypothetical protein
MIPRISIKSLVPTVWNSPIKPVRSAATLHSIGETSKNTHTVANRSPSADPPSRSFQVLLD